MIVHACRSSSRLLTSYLGLKYNLIIFSHKNMLQEAEFKEFEPWFKFKPRLKYGWFHLKLY